ncbi:MAG: DNA-processing protein DprA [Clostridia bacterium]|nr:DNA-processing protein DprA [Clostridia bacterium]
MDRKLLRIWLSKRVIGKEAFAVILEEYFGTIEAVYEATSEEYLKVDGVTSSLAAALSDKNLDTAKEIVKNCEQLGIDILIPEDKYFPHILLTLSQPCTVLYSLGTVPDWNEIFGITIVGMREADEYGQTATERISSELSQKGVTVISGMARGIDSYALRSAVRLGAPTVAVMGCGLDTAYPPENLGLMNDIIKNGCALSEYPPFTPPKPENFPKRNRIMCALGDGVLAVEARKKSGTLITARYARETGKPLFAVPGSIFSKKCEGTNSLIKDGAKAVSCAEDILDEFPILKNRLKPLEKMEEVKAEPKEEKVTIEGLSDEENLIISYLRQKDMHIEELAAKTNFSITKLNGMLTMLEIGGYIKKLAGNNYKFNV